MPVLTVNPKSDAAREAPKATGELRTALERIAAVPVAVWLTRADSEAKVREIETLPGKAVFVAYFIPDRDLGSHSAGGASSSAEYRAFIASIVRGFKGHTPIVILEPDAIAMAHRMESAARTKRYALLAEAVRTLADAGAAVYLDAGTATWHAPAEMAERLEAAGVAHARGWALNVSHYGWLNDQIAYNQRLRAILGTDKHAVIDTARNGQGPPPDGIWGNWRGLGVGERPTVTPGVEGVDAFLWVKSPESSDANVENAGGKPEGGKTPPPGATWSVAAIAAVRNARPPWPSDP